MRHHAVNIETCVTCVFVICMQAFAILHRDQTPNQGVKLWKSAMETLEMLEQAYGNEATSQGRCSERHLCFKRVRSQDNLMILMHNTPIFLDIFEGYTLNISRVSFADFLSLMQNFMFFSLLF